IIAMLILLGQTVPLAKLPVTGRYMGPDDAYYLALALNLSEGKGYVRPFGGSPLLGRAPFFPWLIASGYQINGVSADTGFWVIRVVGVLNLIVLFLLARQLAGAWAGLAATALLLSSEYLSHYFFTRIGIDTSQALFMNLSLLLLLVGFRNGKRFTFTLAGASLALAFLVKELALLWAPLPLLAVLLVPRYRTRRHIVGVGFFLLVFAVAPAGWFTYASLHSGQLALAPRVARLKVLIWPIAGMTLTTLVGTALAWRRGVHLRMLRDYLERWCRHRASRCHRLAAAGGLLLLVAFWLVTSDATSLQSIQSYVSDRVLPLLTLTPLILLAWLFVAYRALSKMDGDSDALLLLALLLYLPVFTLLARWGNQPRNLIAIFI
ncbi:MAG TPA: hypothetical protein EYP04_01305, partial [Anaerolineae bacterium]|nr:hypothetical protein [Anaerolineae bacterium]